MSPSTLKTLFSKGKEFIKENNYNEALKVFLEIEKLSESVTDKDFLAELFASIGVAHIYLSNHGNAVEYLNKAKNLFHEVKNYDRESDCLSQIARTQWSFFGAKALETLFEEVDLCLQNGMEEKLASCYCNICACYLSLGENENSAYYGKLAAEIAERANNTRFLSRIYLNLGNIELNKENYKEAEEYYNKSIEYSKLNDDETGVAINYDNLAYASSCRDDSKEKALNYVKMSQEILKRKNDNYALAQSYQSEARVYKNIGDTKSAIECVAKTIKLAEEHGYQEVKMLSLSILYGAHKSDGNYKEAYEAYSDYIGLRTKIFDESSKKKNEYLAVIHKIEIEKSESDLLQQKNDELNNLNKQLNTLNKEKNEFLNIAAKELSNPLNSISLLSSTLKSFYDKYSQEDFFERINKIESASSRMQEIVENLLQNVRHNTSE